MTRHPKVPLLQADEARARHSSAKLLEEPEDRLGHVRYVAIREVLDADTYPVKC